MKILLDTNLIIHREASTVVRDDIGEVYRWIDNLKYQKFIHPDTVKELSSHEDARVVRSMTAKIGAYNQLRTITPDSNEIAKLRLNDTTPQDVCDTNIIKELHSGKVDILLSEDNGIHRKAGILRASEKVYTIDDFLQKVRIENPKLTSYKVLPIREEYFGNIDVDNEPFFESFIKDYKGFSEWFKSKSDEEAYVCYSAKQGLVAFLYVKIEDEYENYSDISPAFQKKKRLKIGTLKVVQTGRKMGERFLKIVFDNALINKVDEIYVTIFEKEDLLRLISLLEEWGFKRHGTKSSKSGKEAVFVRDFSLSFNPVDPRLTYPYLNTRGRKFIVPIKPDYHTKLLPDSILRTESPSDYDENLPHQNSLQKVYVSRSIERDLRLGDIIVFYRTRDEERQISAYYSSVTTTLGVVQGVELDIRTFEGLRKACDKRTVFTDDELKELWDRRAIQPFVVNFLYFYSFPKRLNLKKLTELGIIESAPRGFERLSDEKFELLMKESNAEKSFIVN